MFLDVTPVDLLNIHKYTHVNQSRVVINSHFKKNLQHREIPCRPVTMQRSFLMLSQEIRITGFLQETLAYQMDRKKGAPLFQGQVDRCSTPLKFNMEPENEPLEEEIPTRNHHFQVPC